MERKRSLRDGRQSKRSFRKESPEEEKRSKRSSFNGDVCLQSFDSESKDPNEAFEFEKESANEELPYQRVFYQKSNMCNNPFKNPYPRAKRTIFHNNNQVSRKNFGLKIFTQKQSAEPLHSKSLSPTN